MPRARFLDRQHAGRELAELLTGVLTGLDVDDTRDLLVLGLPRGGVVVAAEVASVLGADLDVVVVRKVGHPRQPELALGAVAEDGTAALDDRALRSVGLTAADLGPVVAAEQAECRRRTELYRGGRPAPVVAGRTALVVDDGVATGLTALAALALLQRKGASRLVLAAPVAAADSVERLRPAADDVVVVLVPRRFGAVSRFYEVFDQTTDDEVVGLLRA